MSRIGKLPVDIPEKVKVSVSNNVVTVEGPKGKLEKQIHADVNIAIEDGKVVCSPVTTSRFANAMYGTARSIISNMVEGVVNGFSKNLEINGVGFQAVLKGNVLNLKLGYSHDINYNIPAGVNITMEGSTKIKVEGIDKHMVGQAAASIKKFHPVEPYKGKGVRIVGEHVIRKEGKTVA